ncbi:hypothetical protein [Mycolicibacterium fortuitum]|uniref:hypothetical protein n=1 Tax=Mycolicibacterium fortuitum TaxID=1766 RepID=UPI0010422DCD|nr:hypothetical protein [Mycolicibacterium fortuitum]
MVNRSLCDLKSAQRSAVHPLLAFRPWRQRVDDHVCQTVVIRGVDGSTPATLLAELFDPAFQMLVSDDVAALPRINPSRDQAVTEEIELLDRGLAEVTVQIE